jgi:hypothetical protein
MWALIIGIFSFTSQQTADTVITRQISRFVGEQDCYRQ